MRTPDQRTRRVLSIALFSATSVACRNDPPEPPAPQTSAGAARASIARARPAPSASTQSKQAPGAIAEWVETRNFRLRVLDAAPCSDESKEGESSAKKSTFRLGVTIEVEATQHATTAPVVVSPAGATLEKAGKVFRALRKPEATPGCDNLIGLEKLGPGEGKRGKFVFSAPDESYLRSAVFAFKPPRWGGEKRLEVRLPDCFGDKCS